MASEYIRYRSDLLGTQVITRDGGKRLGMVSQLWVDVDRKEVVAIGLRENMLSKVLANTEQVMLLSEVRQLGDVILVDDDMALEDPSLSESYSNLINCSVVTETGEPLGRVRGYKFDVMTGELQALIIASVGLPQIPDQVVSTYELPIEEVVSSGPDRLIVFEGAEDKMVQITVGLLERLGISSPPWERDDLDDYMMPTPPANQLGTGLKTPAPPLKEMRPAREERWAEPEYVEPLPRREPEPLRRAEAYPPEPRYAEPPRPESQRPYYPEPEPTSNWDDDSNWDESPLEAIAANNPPSPAPSPDADVTSDVWGEPASPQQEDTYTPPPVNLPERRKRIEYEEETDY